MRIAIFGSGGVGGYFGGRLAQAGEDVVFIARGAHLQAMQQDGLRVESINGDFVLPPVQATDDPASVGVVDLVLLGVKAWQVPEAAAAIRPLVGEKTAVLPLQNGIDAPAQLAAVLGAAPVLGGLCAIMSYVVAPGHIRHAGIEPIIQLGELDNTPSERTAAIRGLLDKPGITAIRPADIQVAMWQKFLFIAALSGVGAVTRVPMGIFRTLPQTRVLLEQVLQEGMAVGLAHRVALPPDTVARTLARIDGLPPQGTASMQRDVMEKRPSELEAQTGAIVRLGQQLGIPTPVNSFIYASLLPQELAARAL